MRVIMGAMAALLATGAAAADKPIPPDDWRKMTLGKTLHYFKDGEPYGREYYMNPQGDVVFRFPNGVCAEGRWAYAEGKYCFAFGQELFCFHHVMRGDKIVVIGEEDGDEQTIESISDHEPLSCAKEVSS